MRAVKATLWTVLGLLVILLALAGGAEPEPDEAIQTVQIDTGDAVATGPRTVDDVRAEVLVAALDRDFDLEAFRARLRQDRVTLNLEQGNRIATRRLRTIRGLRPLLVHATTLALLLLLGPFWIARRAPPPDRLSLALRSVPYFVVATAVTLALSRFIIDLVFELQELQVIVASFGSLSASTFDASLAYLLHTSDADFLAFVDRLEAARAHFYAAPFAEDHGMGYLYEAVGELGASDALRRIADGFNAVVGLLDLYGPLLGILALWVAISVLRPLVPALARYPLDALTDPEAPSTRQFVWAAVRRFGRELKVMLWAMLAIAVIQLGALAIVRLLAMPVVGVTLRVLFASDAVVAAGSPPPEAGLLLSNGSVAVALLGAVLPLVVSAALVLSRLITVVRERSETRRPFAAFPNVRALLVQAFHATWPTLVAALLALAVYQLAWPNTSTALARVWLPAPIFGPLVLAAALWRRVPQRLWALARVDVLA